MLSSFKLAMSANFRNCLCQAQEIYAFVLDQFQCIEDITFTPVSSQTLREISQVI
jgi:hypothetical protein